MSSDPVQGSTVTAPEETYAYSKGLVEQVQRRVESRAGRDVGPDGHPSTRRGGPLQPRASGEDQAETIITRGVGIFTGLLPRGPQKTFALSQELRSQVNQRLGHLLSVLPWAPFSSVSL